MDALAQDAAQMLLALHDSHVCAGFMCGKCSRHAGGAAADNDHVEGLCRHRATDLVRRFHI